MKVFVTGAAGYVGSVVAERLVDEDIEVVAFDSLKNGHREAVHPKAQLIVGDLLDKTALEKIFQTNRFDAVIHLAAEALIDESIRNPGLFFQVNVTGGLNLLEAMVGAGVKKMVFSSTAAIYGEPRKLPIKEDDTKDPVNAYGESKLQFENILHWFERAHGLSSISFRYFNACGATAMCGEDRPRETHIIPILFEVAEGKHANFNLFGTDYDTQDGSCIRDYVHVADIAAAHLLALSRVGKVKLEKFNLGSGSGYSNKEVITAVEKVIGKKLPIITAPRRDGDPARLVASNDKAKKVLGWQPRFTTIEEMVETAWQWRLKHPEGYHN